MSDWLPRLNQNTYTGCGDCITACPTNALALVEGKAVLVFPDLCTYCAICETICPVDAIELPYIVVRYDQKQESIRGTIKYEEPKV